MFVRHAEREPVLDLRTHERARLTPQGHADAKESGALLAKLSSYVRVHHSPVERCGETARGLVEGAAAAGARAEVIRELQALGSPFIVNPERVSELIGPGEAKGRINFKQFMRDWFDGRHPPEILMARGPAAVTQLGCVVEHLGTAQEDGVHVFVSHDWNIMLVREEVLGIKLEDKWPHYLDGFVVALDGDELVIDSEGVEGRWKRSR